MKQNSMLRIDNVVTLNIPLQTQYLIAPFLNVWDIAWCGISVPVIMFGSC